MGIVAKRNENSRFCLSNPFYRIILVYVMIVIAGLSSCAAQAPRVYLHSFDGGDGPFKKIRLFGTLWDATERRSPDGKYVARTVPLDGEAARLYVCKASTPLRDTAQRSFVLADDAHGCIWLPSCGHALAFSSGGADYGTGILAIWRGPGRRIVIQHAKSDVDDGFNIMGISKDGEY